MFILSTFLEFLPVLLYSGEHDQNRPQIWKMQVNQRFPLLFNAVVSPFPHDS